MATLDENCLRENGLSEAAGIVLPSLSSVKKSETEDVPDYNEAFPQLSGPFDPSRSNTFFSSALPYSSPLNGNSTAGATLPNTTSSLYAATKNDEDRRRKLAMHASTNATKIIEIPPNERMAENSRRSGQSSRNNGANNASNTNVTGGPAIQKLFTRIQKETSTIVTFFYKDQTLIVSITGRPENVRIAQVQILRELQAPVEHSVNIPLDFHRYIIGTRGATLQRLEHETMTTIKVPSQDKQSIGILIKGAKDNVKLCEQKILELYHAQLNKGFERLSIPCLYHPWIRNQLVDELRQQLNVQVDVPPLIKQTDEISIRGEREPVEQAKARILQFFSKLNGKIMTFPLEIPCVQHRFILGKKGAGLKEIFDKTNVVVRIPNQEDESSTIQVIGETANIGEAITMIYKMANASTVVQINAPRWMQSVVRGERNAHLENLKKSCPEVRIFFRDDHVDLEGPPEEVERARGQIQTAIDELRNSKTTYDEIDIDPQYYKQLIGKNQLKLLEIQDQTGCDIKFPYEENRLVKLMGTKESVEKARQMLLERVQKLGNERTADVSIDPQFYPQIIGAKGKNLDEVRSKFHNIQITFPDANGKSDKVKLHGDKDDVDKCSRFLTQKFKDMYSVEIDIPRRLHPMLIGKGGANIQRIREQASDVRIDIPPIDDTSESTRVRISGKKLDVDKARKLIDEQVIQLNVTMENSLEESITIDPKWHVRFFIRNRELLNELQQYNGGMLMKFPERNTGSDQVILRGSKETIDQVRKRLEELIDLWENTVTKEMIIPHRHHRYLLAKGGSYIQPIQKEFNVQIKFPPRGNNNNNNKPEQQHEEQASNPPAEESSSNDETAATKQDRVRFIGRSDDIEKAMAALEKMIPVESTVEIPHELHGSLLGKAGANIQSLIVQYPDVEILFPNVNLAQNNVFLKGQHEQVEGVRTGLLERYEKLEADRQARSFELRFTIKPEFRYLILGSRGRTIKTLREKFDVNIQIANKQPAPSAIVPATSSSDEPVKPTDDDQQATPQDDVPLPTEPTATTPILDLELIITGYEEKALNCRDEILQMIKDHESKITMEIEIDHRIHARIIGSGGQKLQAIQKEFNVEIKFPTNNHSDKVHVTGNDQTKIDGCIDHLLILEEDFLEDIPYGQKTNVQGQGEMTFGHQLANAQQLHPQQEVPSSHAPTMIKPPRDHNKAKQRQAPFKVKNAPWGSTQSNGIDDENDEQQQQQMNGQGRPLKNGGSPKKSSGKHTPAPNRDDLAEFPSFTNGLSMPTEDVTSQVQSTTVKAVPISWGPPKRNK